MVLLFIEMDSIVVSNSQTIEFNLVRQAYKFLIFILHNIPQIIKRGVDMETNGCHILIDAFGCKTGLLNHTNKLERLLVDTVERMEMQILNTHFHQFHPEGVTGVILLSTSHISIHTWPEQNYVSFDLYTCGNRDAWSEIDTLLRELGANYANVYELSRGNKDVNSLKRMTFYYQKFQNEKRVEENE